MKTLKELIDDGLPVGALVKHMASGEVWQRIKNKGITLHFKCVFDPLSKEYDSEPNQEGNFGTLGTLQNKNRWHPTTAYDSQIAPETLPIPEPFWTGWVASLAINPVPIQAETTELFYIDTDGSSVYKSECQPCLPPA